MKKNKIGFYLTWMRARGFSDEDTLKNSELTAAMVNSADFRASPRHFRQIITNMLELTGDRHLGLAFGSEFKISDLGILGYAALSSATLMQARDVISKYSMLNEHILTPSIHHLVDGQWRIEFGEAFPLGDAAMFAIEEAFSRAIHVSSALINSTFPLLKMSVTFPEPESTHIYQKYFDCPIFFGQPENIIYVLPEGLKAPITFADEDAFQVCEHECEKLLEELKNHDRLADQIRRKLLKIPGEFPSLSEMADNMNTSSRTFRRQLASEDITYQQVVDSTRRDLAIQYLNHTNLKPKEIGYLLGYTNVSNFRRAFKTWTGKKLSNYIPSAPPNR